MNAISSYLSLHIFMPLWFASGVVFISCLVRILKFFRIIITDAMSIRVNYTM